MLLLCYSGDENRHRRRTHKEMEDATMKKVLSLIVVLTLILAVPAFAERTLTWNEVNGET